jgi:uncharacterized glyoxalase superfamily protein PhnB
MEFYARAFGAEELFRVARADGKILHAEISICGSVVMLGEPDGRLYAQPRALGRTTASLHVFTDDNAALLRRAVDAGRAQCRSSSANKPRANAISGAIEFNNQIFSKTEELSSFIL